MNVDGKDGDKCAGVHRNLGQHFSTVKFQREKFGRLHQLDGSQSNLKNIIVLRRVGNPNPESAQYLANFGIQNPKYVFFYSGFGFLIVRLKLAP